MIQDRLDNVLLHRTSAVRRMPWTVLEYPELDPPPLPPFSPPLFCFTLHDKK